MKTIPQETTLLVISDYSSNQANHIYRRWENINWIPIFDTCTLHVLADKFGFHREVYKYHNKILFPVLRLWKSSILLANIVFLHKHLHANFVYISRIDYCILSHILFLIFTLWQFYLSYLWNSLIFKKHSLKM